MSGCACRGRLRQGRRSGCRCTSCRPTWRRSMSRAVRLSRCGRGAPSDRAGSSVGTPPLLRNELGRAGHRLALQLHIFSNSESMGNHDSEDHGWCWHRSRQRWSCGPLALRDVKSRMRVRYSRRNGWRHLPGLCSWTGLLGEERRKTGWMRAEAAGDPGPWRQQAVLGRGRWDADALRDIVREYALETLAADGCGAGDRRDRLSSSRAGRRAAWGGNTRGLPARSPTARSACSQPTSRATATPSSTARCICPRVGPTTRPA